MLVSIIIPSFNSNDALLLSITSALSQTHANIEVIIVHDGSTDNSVGVSKLFTDHRLRCIELPTNMGVCHARNQGLLQATGEWVQFLDADDYLLPTKLARQLSCVEGADIVLSDCLHIYEDGTHIAFKGINKSGKLSIRDLLFDNPIPIHSPLIRRQIIKNHLYFYDGYAHEDWAFWLRLSIQEPILVYVPGIECVYRRRRTSRSGDLIKNYMGRITCLERVALWSELQNFELQNIVHASLVKVRSRLVRLFYSEARTDEGDAMLKTIESELSEEERRTLLRGRGSRVL